MILRFGTLTVAMATLLAGSGPAAAQAGDVPTAVLGLEAVDAPDTITTEITEALRQRVAGTKGFQLVQGKDLVEIKLVYSCSDEAPACMAQAGKSLGASKLIFGSVKRSGTDYVVTLKLLDTGRAAVESSTSDTIAKKRADPTAIRSLAAKWVAKLSGKPGGGSLQVRANVSGAAVTLDGVQVGVTGERPVAIADVNPGRHEVAVEKAGYTKTKQEFTLAQGQSLPLSLSMSPLSVNVPTPSEPVTITTQSADDTGESGDGSRTLARAGFWTALIGAAGSAALALKFGNDVKRINRDLDPYRRYPCSANTGMCDYRGDPSVPLTLPERTTATSLSDQGSRAQTLQWVFIGLVPPFVIAGGFLLYKGYLESEGGTKTSDNRGLRIFPTASASAGGIVAEFDF